MKRRSFMLAGAALLCAPVILRAQAGSGTPVVAGKRIRRRLSSLASDDPFFDAYGRAITEMHRLTEDNPRSWMAQARIHADFCSHGDMEFFPWHRPYLNYFEKICGELIGDPNFAVPYWHWGDNGGRLPAPFFGGGPLDVVHWNDVSNYQSRQWGLVDTVSSRYARADFGLRDGPFAGQFSDQSLANVENASTFDTLSRLTENPHGTAHFFTGGSPSLGSAFGHFSAGLSPLDPVFWLHHANVDRIWANSAIAIATQKAVVSVSGVALTKTYDGMFVDAGGAPASAKLDDAFDLANFDYSYDFLIPELLSLQQRQTENQIIESQDTIIEFAKVRDLSLTPQVSFLASAEAGDTAIVGAISTISVDAKAIPDALTRFRVAPRRLTLSTEDALTLHPGRIYASFRGVLPLEGAVGNALKVFVSCPYLSEATPTTDPHFSDALSFFGCDPSICGELDFTIELTDSLRYLLETGALPPDKINIQLLAFSGTGELTGKPVARIGGIDLISA